MYKNKKILVVIPARSGSKGLPGKNIKVLCGKPLIGWSIEQSVDSKYVDKTIVSTDSDVIANIALNYGAVIPFLRPQELAQDTTPTIDVINHLIENLKETYDILVLIEPTSPLRKKDDIDNCIKLLCDNFENSSAVISLGEVHMENPYICKVLKDNKVKSFIECNKTITRRQDLDTVYFPYGVAYVSKIDTLLKSQTFYQNNALPYIIDRWQNYEIDDVYDFICVESIIKYKKGILN